MKNFADRLTERIEAVSNPTVMGLDPKLDFIPEEIMKRHEKQSGDPAIAAAEAIYEFNVKLIDAVCTIIPAIKPQFAYYEMYGIHGLETLYKSIQYAKSKGMLVIADAKRNDIGTTAEAYAKAIIGKTVFSDKSVQSMTGADAVTVNAYLGIDGIKPFIDEARGNSCGLFVLVRTSNASAGDFQDLRTEDGTPLYEKVAAKVSEWGSGLIGESGYSSVGAVVGATWPEQASKLRTLMPHTMILVPGYGAQGGDADSAAVNFDANGRGAIVNASRSLMCAYKKREDLMPDDFQKATYEEALRMKNDLNRAIERKAM